MHSKSKRATATHNKRTAHIAADTCTAPLITLAAFKGRDIITRKNLADILGVTPHAIDYHKRQGRLVPVYYPGSKHARGFTRVSVLTCFGKSPKNAKAVK